MTDTIQKLKDRIKDLEEELRQFRADLVQDTLIFVGVLSEQQSALLMGIYSRSFASYRYLDYITETYGKYNRYEGEMPQRLRTKVAVWKLRKTLKPHGIEVHILRGVGYYLDNENRAKLKKLMENNNDHA
jgi:hypothetical protein